MPIIEKEIPREFIPEDVPDVEEQEGPTFAEENQALFEGFLQRYYFDYWEDPATHSVPHDPYGRSLELYPTAVCNTNCTYCYLKNFSGETFYDQESKRPKVILHNTKMILDYLLEKDLRPPTIEVFSGDIFAHTQLWEPYFELIYDFVSKVRDPEGIHISVPTNATWIMHDDKVQKIEDLIQRFADLGARISFSMSVDGLIVDNYSRPFKNPNIKYTEEFYDKLFMFAKKYNYSMHPMISAHNIKDWVENYQWFISQWKSVGVEAKEAVARTYLLEVRNPDWTPENLLDLIKFLRKTVTYLYEEVYEKDLEMMYDNVIQRNHGNLFGSGFGSVGRGMLCNIEPSLAIRADLKLISCHRLGYAGYEGGELATDGEKITGITAKNPMSFMASRFHDFRKGLMCESCPIKYACGGYCLGANYEMTGEQYLPVPTTCRLELVKLKALVDAYEDIGLLRALKAAFREGTTNVRSIGAWEFLQNYDSEAFHITEETE
ncbi:MAG: radical SAM protein [Actinobacteria bacterium]|nr:radical SAM protein [Actinomycetota bacterium]MCA1807037.1 radical SAM protein [Actinomycetota bacterium]